MFLRRPPAGQTSRTGWGFAAGVGTVVALAIAGGVQIFTEEGFRASFFANFLSTVAGVAVGVPVAIWLTLRESGEQAKAAAQTAREMEDARRREVLTAIRRELCENRVTLQERRPSPAAGRALGVPFLMDEVWSAMSDGGQLQWIRDTDLLRQVARAYVFIRTIIYLERSAFEIMHFPGQQRFQVESGGKTDPSQSPLGQVVSYLDHQDFVCIAAIDEALVKINVVVEEPAGDDCPDPPTPATTPQS
jgi:hypothetical protein